MATSGPVREQFAAKLGELPSAMDRRLRALRAAGEVPPGEGGRVQHIGHYETPHLGSVISSLGALQLADSAEAAKLFSNLPFEGQFSPMVTFAQALERWIDIYAHVHDFCLSNDNINATAAIDFANRNLPDTLELTMFPATARMVWYDNGAVTNIECYFYNTPPSVVKTLSSSDIAPIKRTTFLDGKKLIMLAGKLLRSNPSWKPTLHLPFLTPAVPNAGQESENAGPIPTSPAPASNQDAISRNPSGVTHSEYAGEREEPQLSPSRDLARPLSKQKVRHVIREKLTAARKPAAARTPIG